MTLLEQATLLVGYAQQLLSQNNILITAQAEAAVQLADLQQKLATALSQDAADKEAVQFAQDVADAARKQAEEIKVAADKADAEVVGLQEQVANMINANAEVSAAISSVVIPPLPPTIPAIVQPEMTPVTAPEISPIEVPVIPEPFQSPAQPTIVDVPPEGQPILPLNPVADAPVVDDVPPAIPVVNILANLDPTPTPM